MSLSILLELPDDQAEVLDRIAAGMSRSPREAMAVLMNEALQHEQFPQIEFRDSPCGRQAYIVGSSLAAWELIMIAEGYDLQSTLVATHMDWPQSRVEGVIRYYRAHPHEIDRAIAENDAITPAQMKQALPGSIWTV